MSSKITFICCLISLIANMALFFKVSELSKELEIFYKDQIKSHSAKSTEKYSNFGLSDIGPTDPLQSGAAESTDQAGQNATLISRQSVTETLGYDKESNVANSQLMLQDEYNKQGYEYTEDVIRRGYINNNILIGLESKLSLADEQAHLDMYLKIARAINSKELIVEPGTIF